MVVQKTDSCLRIYNDYYKCNWEVTPVAPYYMAYNTYYTAIDLLIQWFSTLTA